MARNPWAFVGLGQSGNLTPSSIGPFGINRESRPGSVTYLSEKRSNTLRKCSSIFGTEPYGSGSKQNTSSSNLPKSNS